MPDEARSPLADGDLAVQVARADNRAAESAQGGRRRAASPSGRIPSTPDSADTADRLLSPSRFVNLFDEFRAESWTAWRKILSRITPATRELVAVAGRGSGKSRMAAVLATWAATSKRYERVPGETIFVSVIAPDRRQARVTFSYVVGLLHARPELEALVQREARESVELSNGVTVEVITASTVAPRGRSYAFACVEEAAFLPSGDSANPDVELLRAIRPALARVPGSLLAIVSSPYSRRGVLWHAAKRHAEDGDGDGRVLFVQAPTLELNPTFDAEAVRVALEEDPAGARAEYLAEFRSDVESFLTLEAITACVVSGRVELPPTNGTTYSAFVDPSGGSRDSFCIAVGHHEDREGQPVAIVDAIRERRPPFSPEAVVAEFAALLRSYQIRTIVGDRYAGEWPREAFARHGVTYEPAPKSKSEIYRDALALVNGQRVELPDSERLVTQLVSLERRTARGGRDIVDHPPAGSDDVANVACGVAVNLALADRTPTLTALPSPFVHRNPNRIVVRLDPWL